jgi:hypothetical protein
VLRFRGSRDNYDQGCKVWRDGRASEEIRLAAVAGTARRLESRVVIGLYLDVLPLPGPIEGNTTADLDDRARKLGNEMEEVLAKRLRSLDRLIETRPCFEISAIAPAAREKETMREKVLMSRLLDDWL